MATATKSSGTSETEIRCDALVIGAGFSGIAMLYRLRKLGLTAKILEAGDDFGGTWNFNRYPGARVDSEFPFYQLSIPELCRTWSFTERYPDHRELRRYFAHAARVLRLAPDTVFRARVVAAAWDDAAGAWTVRTAQGHAATARFLLLCTGLLHRRHEPALPGLAAFRGRVCHSAAYPADLDLDPDDPDPDPDAAAAAAAGTGTGTGVRGRHVALVGAGATAVQITQALAPPRGAARLTVLLRRPSLCLPARQRALAPGEAAAWRAFVPSLLALGRGGANGFMPADAAAAVAAQRTLAVPPTERARLWEELWAGGAFRFWVLNYPDVVLSPEANRLVYEFWAHKVRARMTDPAKMDLLAPLPAERMPYYIFTKRPPLEMDYYECVDRPEVELINVNTTPYKTFNETGLLMEDGRQIDFDVLILATGFDAFSGSLATMGLKSRDGLDIKDHWKDGLRAYLGTTLAGYPNAFMTYTPHAPTAFSNGPAIIEAQADFACAAIRKILASERGGARGIKSIEALAAAEDEWAAYIEAQNAPTLFPQTPSWWTGANIPGKKIQMTTYLRGLAEYEKEIHARLERLEGFDVRYWGDGDGGGGGPQATAVAGPEPLERKVAEGPVSLHVELEEDSVNGASEAVAMSLPTAST